MEQNTTTLLIGLVVAVFFLVSKTSFTAFGRVIKKAQVSALDTVHLRALITAVLGLPILYFLGIPLPDPVGLGVATFIGAIITLNDSKSWTFAGENTGAFSRLKTTLTVVTILVIWMLIAQFFPELPQLSGKQQPLSVYTENPLAFAGLVAGIILVAFAAFEQRKDRVSFAFALKVWPLTILSVLQALAVAIFVLRYKELSGTLIQGVASYAVLTAISIAVWSFIMRGFKQGFGNSLSLYRAKNVQLSVAATVIMVLLNGTKYAATGLLANPAITDVIGRLEPLTLRLFGWDKQNRSDESAEQQTKRLRAEKWQWVMFIGCLIVIASTILVGYAS